MSAAVTLIATAAATVGAVTALRTIQRRLAEGERRVEAVKRRRRERVAREAEMIDLEPDAETGIYGVPPAGRAGREP